MRQAGRVVVGMLFLGLCSAGHGQSKGADPAWQITTWVHSYKAGHNDKNGQYLGGSQMMHLVPYKGKLYAGLSYWQDARNMLYGGKDYKVGWGQILRLDSPDAEDRWCIGREKGWCQQTTLTAEAHGQSCEERALPHVAVCARLID